MNLKHLTKQAAHVAADNSPTILTALGVAGTMTTGWLFWKAGRAHQEIVRNTENMNVDVTRREEFDLTWKLYIVPAATGVLTIASIVASNRIGTRRAAAMAAAYTVMTTDYEDYRNMVAKKFTAKKEKEVRDEVNKEKVLANPPPVAIFEDGQSWFCDLSTMRYFKSDRAHCDGARNDLNYMLQHEGMADLNEAYAFLGLDSTGVGGQLGWTGDQKVEIVYTAVLMPDGSAATAFTFNPEPKPDFDSLH